MASHSITRPSRRYNLNDYSSALSGSFIPTPPAAAHSLLATGWSTRVVANGGATPSDNTLTYIDTFSASLVSAAISTKILACNIFAPDNITASITPLIVGGGNDPWTNSGTTLFKSTDLTVNGLAGNGTAYLKTGIVPLTIYGSNQLGGLALYISAWASAAVWDFACYTSGYGNTCHINADGSTIDFNYPANGAVAASSTGFWAGSRTSATSETLYKGTGSLFAALGTNVNNTVGTNISFELYCFAGNAFGSAGQIAPATRRYSFAAATSPLTQTETNNLFSAVQALRTSFGGGYI